MSHTSAIGSLASGTYSLARRALGTTNASGVYTPGASTTSTITASVQPVGVGRRGGATAAALSEGRSADDIRTIYTTSELRAAPLADLITIDGAQFEVFQVERWDALGQVYYKALAARVVRQ